MKKAGLILAILLWGSLYESEAWAQAWTAGDNVTLHIEDYCLIATNNAPIVLSLTSATAGQAAQSTSNSDLYVKISSIVPGATNRELTAKISSGTVPTGTTLTLVSAPCTTTNSGGILGTPNATPITLSAIDQSLVTGIRTCYTGTGSTDGYRMTFTWRPTSPATTYGTIGSATTNMIVVFTITAHDGN